MNKQIDLKFLETAINVKNQYFCTLINEINLEEMKKSSCLTAFFENFYQKYCLSSEEIEVLMLMFREWIQNQIKFH